VAELYQAGALDELGADLDKVLATDPLAVAQAGGDKEPLCRALIESIDEFQRFPMLYTSVECFTDRVFLGEWLSIVTKCYTGGFATRNKYSRTHAVSYEGLGTDFAALVLKARPDRFKALIHNFAGRPLTGRLRLWTLQHGTYRLTCGVDSTGRDQPDKIDRAETVEVMRATPVEVVLPPGKTSVIELVQSRRLDDERQRADLALSALDTKVVKDGPAWAVESVAHNIGAKDVASVEVALADGSGKIVQRKKLGPLDAPIDLVPRRIKFKFENLPPDVAGWSIVIDPDNAVEEIYEGNNRVELKGRGTRD
jgi:hypothetical protein